MTDSEAQPARSDVLRVLAYALICCIAGVILLAVALQYGRPFYLAIGSGEDRYISGWRNDDEVVVQNGQRLYFRWVLDEGRLRFPIRAIGGELEVRVHAQRHAPGEISIVANFEPLLKQQMPPLPWRDFSFPVPRGVAERGPLTLIFLTTPTPENLALAIDWIEVRKVGSGWILPAADLLFAYLLGIVLLYAAGWLVGGARFTTIVVAAALAVSAIGLLHWKMPTITIIFRMWPLLLAMTAAIYLVKYLRSNRAVGSAFLIGMVVQAAFYFHPYLYPPDLHYHFRFAEKLIHLPLEEIYRVSVMYDIPGEFSLNYPYSPVFHLVTGVLCPSDADLKYAEKLIVMIAYGIAGLCLAVLAKRLELGTLPLLLYFIDPTLLRHLYRCHMPGMFGISATSAFLLLLSMAPLTTLSRTRLVFGTLFLSFAMCTYPASFLQLSIFSGLLLVVVVVRPSLRAELPRLLIVCAAAFAIAMFLFYGHYLHLIWKFFLSSRTQVVAAGRSASVGGMLAIWWKMLSVEKAWPFYVPALVGLWLMRKRQRDGRWNGIQLAWGLTFVAQMILTSDYLLPSVRTHIKEMAFLTPLVVLWESEGFLAIWRGNLWRKCACAAFLALLLVLAGMKLAELIRIGFAMP